MTAVTNCNSLMWKKMKESKKTNLTLWGISSEIYIEHSTQLGNRESFFSMTSFVKNPPDNAGDAGSILGQEDHLEEEIPTRSSILAWKIPWIEEPGRPQSLGSQRVGHDWATEHPPMTFTVQSSSKDTQMHSFVIKIFHLYLVPSLIRRKGYILWSCFMI